MDPLTGAIVAAVIWFFVRTVITVAIVWAGIGLGALIVYFTDHKGFALVPVVLGWLAAIAWEIFAIIQVVIEVVRIVQLIS